MVIAESRVPVQFGLKDQPAGVGMMMRAEICPVWVPGGELHS